MFHLKNDKKFKTGGQFSTWVPTSSLSSAILMHGWLFEEAWNINYKICCHVLGCRKYFTNGAKDLGRFEHLLPHIVHNEAALLRITSSWPWLLFLGDHDWNMFKLCKTLHLNQNEHICPHWSTLLTCIIFCSSQLQFGKSFQNKVVFSTFHILTILNKHVHLRYSAKSFSTNMFSLFFNLPEVFSSRTKYINSVWSFW